jgi:O-acetyl-ADP-ribose deacetylase (regulator of RNase III)
MSKVAITATQGNIVAQVDCDGVVNAANELLIAGAGVCDAIHAAAGPKLEPYIKHFAPLQLGDTIASPGFEMKARLIIHVRGPRYFEDDDPPGNLAKAVRSAILLADEIDIERLAVPAISTGIYGYPPEEAVPIMVATAFELSSHLTSLREIRFVVMDGRVLVLFADAFRGAHSGAN